MNDELLLSDIYHSPFTGHKYLRIRLIANANNAACNGVNIFHFPK
jgi:hypothetical protein